MPQYLVIALDKDEPGIFERRVASRPRHVEVTRSLAERDQLVIGAGIIEASGRIVGSMGVFEFETEEGLREYLAAEPYNEGIWSSCAIYPLWIAYRDGKPQEMPHAVRTAMQDGSVQHPAE